MRTFTLPVDESNVRFGDFNAAAQGRPSIDLRKMVSITSTILPDGEKIKALQRKIRSMFARAICDEVRGRMI